MPAPTPILNRISPGQIRERLRTLADDDGRSYAEIAREAGIAASHLSNVLNGRKANPSIGTVARILAAMRCRWRDLD